MDSEAKFSLTNLPPKEQYENVDGEVISDEDYNSAKEIWSKFQLKNLGELHDLYVSTDTNLLADVFNGFRDTIYKAYSLDPSHYVSAPSLSWSAALKKTKVELELITDIGMI